MFGIAIRERRLRISRAGSTLTETKEIRIYLHGGNDRATVRRQRPKQHPVRIIGGNGTNSFTDLSTVGGSEKPDAVLRRRNRRRT